MEHVFWVIPKRLAGRPGPTYAEWSLPELHAGGFRAVLNLSEFEPDDIEFKAAGITCEWMPISNSYLADDEVEEGCLQVLPRADAFIVAQMEATQPVLVHCAWGRDRTGIVLAYHLALHRGLSAEEAIAEVRKVRPTALSALGWEEMANRVISSLLKEP